MGFKAKLPRAKVPFCWICDGKLWGGGYFYVVVKDEMGHEHPAHSTCVAVKP